MSASKLIMRNLTATVAVLYVVLLACGFIFAGHGSDPQVPVAREDVQQESPGTYFDDGPGDVLDGVRVDYCA